MLRSESQISFKSASCDLLRSDLFFRHPSAEVSYETDLGLRGSLTVALLIHLSCVGIDVLAQGPFMHTLARLGIFED
jgi:hypothetical protein